MVPNDYGYGNGPTVYQMVPNGPKLSAIIQHSQKNVNYVPRLSEMALKIKKWSKNANECKIVQKYSVWSSMVPNDPKWSENIDYKLHRMAFITRFNLVLV